MASTDALFCSASEWPLFFTLFSFFPWLILFTGTALRHRDALSWHLVCPSVSARGYGVPLPAVLLGCLLPDCAQLAAADVSSLGRTHGGRVGPPWVRQPLYSGLHTVSCASYRANRWVWVDGEEGISTPFAPSGTHNNTRVFYGYILAAMALLSSDRSLKYS